MTKILKKLRVVFVYALFSSAIDASWQVETIAGTAGETGNTDAVGSSARFDNIIDLAVDNSGNVFVTDSTNLSIREIVYGSGQYTVSTPIPDVGSLLNGITVDSSGNIYFTNSWNHGMVADTPLEGGGYSSAFLAGAEAGFADGTGGEALFTSPSRIAIAPSGNIYIADSGNHAIRMINPSTREVTTIAGANSGTLNGQGCSDGIGTIAQFYNPTGIAVDSYGNIFVVDSSNNAIRKITYDSGTYTVSTIAGADSGTLNGSGYADGLGTAAQFNNPTAIAVDYSGNLYVTDTGNQLIRMLVNNSGTYTVSTIAGQLGSAGSSDGDGLTAASFNNPLGIAVNNSGDLYVVDNGSNIVRKLINPSGGGGGGGSGSESNLLTTYLSGVDNGINSVRIDTLFTGGQGYYSGIPNAISSAVNKLYINFVSGGAMGITPAVNNRYTTETFPVGITEFWITGDARDFNTIATVQATALPLPNAGSTVHFMLSNSPGSAPIAWFKDALNSNTRIVIEQNSADPLLPTALVNDANLSSLIIGSNISLPSGAHPTAAIYRHSAITAASAAIKARLTLGGDTTFTGAVHGVSLTGAYASTFSTNSDIVDPDASCTTGSGAGFTVAAGATLTVFPNTGTPLPEIKATLNAGSSGPPVVAPGKITIANSAPSVTLPAAIAKLS